MLCYAAYRPLNKKRNTVAAPKNKRFVKIFVIIVAPLFILGIGKRMGGAFRVPPEQKIQRAEFLVKEKDYSAALEKIHEAREVMPQNLKTWLLEAQIYTAQGKTAEALAAYEAAEKIAPRDLDLLAQKVNLFTGLKRYSEAEETLKKIRELRPNYLSEYDLGLLYIKMKKYDLAQAQFEKSKTMNPFFPGVHRNIALLAREKGDLSAAKESFDKYLQLQPKAQDRAAIELWFKQNAAAFESQGSNADSDQESQN